MNLKLKKNKLPSSYYLHDDVVFLAQDLLGKIIYTNIKGQLTSGMIIETEAYKSVNDKASHAYLKKRTTKNESMYLQGGVAYIYICYGIHYLFNIVTNFQDIADAILIRAIEPIDGLEIMQLRTMKKSSKKITSGPGNLSKALGIDITMNKEKLTGDKIWIENYKDSSIFKIVKKPRIGISYSEEDANLKWRFYIKNNHYVSIN